MSNPGKHTYGQILKSSALIGGSSVLNICLGILRAKAMALLIGPGGVGLLGVYSSIADLARSLATMGIGNSGVRQVAEATASGDPQRLARSVTSLRWVALLLSLAGGVLLLVLCRPVARFSFPDPQPAGLVALLALAVWFGGVSAGQSALVQGMRCIRDLALISVLGAFYGTLASVGIIYFLGKDGIVPSLVCAAFLTLATSWWYSRKIRVERVALRLRELSAEVTALLKLGVVFMASGVMTVAVSYVVRLIVIRKLGEADAGFYQAAWALGGLYVGFILQAMGADFFPRLTAVAGNHPECNRLVNEQAEVSLLLAGPGLLATLTFAPWVIRLFYSAEFAPAVDILRWLCLGMMLRVVTWPMGFILAAKGAQKPFFLVELFSNAAQAGLSWVCVLAFGLEGTGIAFFASYVLSWWLVYGIVRSMTGFRWSVVNRRLGLLYGLLVGLVFGGWYVLPGWALLLGGGLITLAVGIFSSKRVCSLVPLKRFPLAAQRLLIFLRLASPNAQA